MNRTRSRLAGALAAALAVTAGPSLADTGAGGPVFLLNISGETVQPDHVLQGGEQATATFTVSELAEPMSGVSWSLQTAGGDLAWSQTEGWVEEIPAGDEAHPFLGLSLTGGSISGLPDRTQVTLTLDDGSDPVVTTHYLSLGSAEVLLISDGMPGVRETLAPALAGAGIVWGYAGVPLNELPDDMFGAYVIVVEAHGLQSQYLFTDQDLPVRDWFRYGNGGSISGLYLDEIYPNADPSWLGGIAGEWPAPSPDTVFYGLEDDEIAQGNVAESCVAEGVSICYPCCGNPANFYTPDGDAVAGWLDYGWRIVDYGFSLVHLDEGAEDLTRDELIARTGNWLLYRETGVDGEPGPGPLPEGFSLRAWPNPFNSMLTIELVPAGARPATVNVLNVKGRLVETLAVQPSTNGPVRLRWDASGHSSGSYYLHVPGGNRQPLRRVVLVK